MCPGMRLLAALMLGAARWFRDLVEAFPTVRLMPVVLADVTLPCRATGVYVTLPTRVPGSSMRVSGYLVRASGDAASVTPPVVEVGPRLQIVVEGSRPLITDLYLGANRAVLIIDGSGRWHLTVATAGDIDDGPAEVAWPGGCSGDHPAAELMVNEASRYRDAEPALLEMLSALERALPKILL